jgi:hypothetical protein
LRRRVTLRKLCGLALRRRVMGSARSPAGEPLAHARRPDEVVNSCPVFRLRSFPGRSPLPRSQLHVRQQPLERGILSLQVLQPPRVVGLQPAELVPPPVVRLLRHTSSRQTSATSLPSPSILSERNSTLSSCVVSTVTFFSPASVSRWRKPRSPQPGTPVVEGRLAILRSRDDGF